MEGIIVEKIIVLRATIGIDSVGRIINVVRRGKVNLQEVTTKFIDDRVVMHIKLDGSENEIDWLSKKLFKLVDVDEMEVIEGA
ncbi:MAG: ACT domain-containing protein [Thermoprotei archaeon]|jgi:acetolactate synthase regulatory subunit